MLTNNLHGDARNEIIDNMIVYGTTKMYKLIITYSNGITDKLNTLDRNYYLYHCEHVYKRNPDIIHIELLENVVINKLDIVVASKQLYNYDRD